MTTAKQIAAANATSRTRGAVGSQAVVPRKVRQLIARDRYILDFGAGKDAAHAAQLRADGWAEVDAYEFGANHNPALHVSGDLDAGRGYYDCVYASNVLNVQADAAMMGETLDKAASFMHGRGIFIANYPASPRKSTVTVDGVLLMLRNRFCCVDTLGTNSAPIFVCQGGRPLVSS